MSNPPILSAVVSGDLTSTTVQALKDRIEVLLPPSGKTPEPGTVLVIDLRSSRFVDSVGINLIVVCIRKMKEFQGAVRVLISNSNLKRILSFMKVDQHAEVVMD